MPFTSIRSARKARLLRTWLPVLACAAIFALESTACFGADRTSRPLQRLTQLLVGHRLDFEWPTVHFYLRKTGHFLGYGLFSLVCFRSFWLTLAEARKVFWRKAASHGLALLSVLLVASLDEFHQSFLPNRTGHVGDVVLNTCGAAALGLVLFVAMLAAEGASRRGGSRPTAPLVQPAA